MKIQKIIGTVLFLCGVAVLWYFTEQRFGNIGYHAGTAFGYTLFIVLVLSTISSIKKNVAPILLISIVWFGSVSYDLFEQAIADHKEMEELLGDFSSGKEISPVQEKSYAGKLIVLMRNYLSQIQKIQNEFSDELKNSGVVNMLAPENLSNVEIAKQSLAKVTTLEKSVSETESKLLAAQNLFELKLSEGQDNYSQEVYKGFQETKNSNVAPIKQYFEIKKNLLNIFSNILSLAIDSKPQFKKGKLLFTDQKSLDLYNDLLEKLTHLSKQEENLLNEKRQQMESAIKSL